ncbi:DUF4342 domain-containing protein [Nonomuraea sp. NPDC049504]|uniref:DUF4342 domain-containing protein n=1 Tax=Nonomuraea sp. NPDC049504 TaxID=3154729 RepID=UPI003418EC40
MTAAREDRVAGTLKTLLREGHVRRIVVKDARGRTVMDVPLTAGAVASVAAPLVTVVAGMTAVAAGWTIDVVRDAAPAPAVHDDESATPGRERTVDGLAELDHDAARTDGGVWG